MSKFNHRDWVHSTFETILENALNKKRHSKKEVALTFEAPTGLFSSNIYSAWDF
jgi:hypothetical protein